MDKQTLKDTLGWGIILWLIGFVLSIVLFKVVPKDMIGWVITPIGIAITLWVLLKKIPSELFSQYLKISMAWTIIAVVFDYLFIVKGFGATDYYKPDIYFYYLTTFLLPIFVGSYKNKPVI